MGTRMLEEELALHVVKELENMGLLVYKEVSIKGGGSRRADIYAVALKDEKVVRSIIVETKMSFNLSVIEQAHSWMRNANLAYVAVPMGKRGASSFAKKICGMLGIGVIEVAINGTCYITVDAVHQASVKLPNLYPEQMDSIAGNANGKFRTPFNITIERLESVLKDGPMHLSAALERSGHHYKSPRTASSSIQKHIADGVIKNIQVISTGKGLMLQLKEKEKDGPETIS